MGAHAHLLCRGNRSTSPGRDGAGRENRYIGTAKPLPGNVNPHRSPLLAREGFPLRNRTMLWTAVVCECRPGQRHIVGNLDTIIATPTKRGSVYIAEDERQIEAM